MIDMNSLTAGENGSLIEFKGEYVRVTCIESVIQLIGYECNSKDDFNAPESLNPIPLTKGLLVKLGWSDDGYKDGFIGKDVEMGGWRSDLPLKVEGGQLYFVFSVGDLPLKKRIDYLHEFQQFHKWYTCHHLDVSPLIIGKP